MSVETCNLIGVSAVGQLIKPKPITPLYFRLPLHRDSKRSVTPLIFLEKPQLDEFTKSKFLKQSSFKFRCFFVTYLETTQEFGSWTNSELQIVSRRDQLDKLCRHHHLQPWAWEGCPLRMQPDEECRHPPYPDFLNANVNLDSATDETLQ